MNERIKELAMICYKEVGDWQYGSIRVFDYEKFAEIIVRDCTAICHERKLTPSAFTGDELLEHFGLEK